VTGNSLTLNDQNSEARRRVVRQAFNLRGHSAPLWAAPVETVRRVKVYPTSASGIFQGNVMDGFMLSAATKLPKMGL
jgi:hypothetical protein